MGRAPRGRSREVSASRDVKRVLASDDLLCQPRLVVMQMSPAGTETNATYNGIRRYTDVAERPDGFVEAGRGREGWSLVLGILSIRILSALVQEYRRILLAIMA
jgi:hypothetical protein